jgi:hypothetical protein
MYTLRAFVALLVLIFQDGKRLQFEVASIKPAAPDARGMWIRPSPGGRLTITNMLRASLQRYFSGRLALSSAKV